MTTALGLVGVAFFIVFVISLAAGVTWLVVKAFPAQDKDKKPAEKAS